MLRWLDPIPLWLLAALALWMALAPFYPQPHLVEKLRLLAHGGLARPIDIFDLCWHAAPLVVLLLKLVRLLQVRG